MFTIILFNQQVEIAQIVGVQEILRPAGYTIKLAGGDVFSYQVFSQQNHQPTALPSELAETIKKMFGVQSVGDTNF